MTRRPNERPNERPTLADTLSSGPLRARAAAGQTAGPYVVEGLIAQGGMGAVFRARHRESGRPAALKLLLLGRGREELKRRRFLREAETLAKLSHPGIVQVYDYGEEGTLPWMAMELVEGETLDLSQKGLRPVSRTIAQIAEALAVAHALGIVHRDLKPANILMRPDGSPVVTDFGVARDLARSSSLTQSGSTVGTPLYMSPEQIRGEAPTPATDVHALGVILFEGLTGEVPWELEELSTPAIMAAISTHRPRPPSALRPGVPRALDEICARCLEKDPTRRYADGAALSDALRSFLIGGRSSPPPARRRVLFALLSVAAIGLALTLGLLLGARPETESAPPEPPPGRTERVANSRAPAPLPAIASHEVVIAPGPVEGLDTYVRNDGLYLNDNFGSYGYMLVGDRNSNGQAGDFRAYLRFDLARVPLGARIQEARLRLSVIGREDRAARPLLLRVHAVAPTSGQEQWREGTGLMDRFVDGVCWDGDASSLPFPNGTSRRPDLSQPEIDRQTDFGRSLPGLVDQVQVLQGQESCDLDLTALVQLWVGARAQNLGLRLSHQPEGAPFDDGRLSLASSDHRDHRLRPRLLVRYEGLPPPPAVPPEETLGRAREAARALVAEAQAGLDPLGDGPTERRLAAAQAAVEVAPFLGDAYFARGALRALLGCPQEASFDLNLAEAVLEPCRDPRLHPIRGQVRLDLGDARGSLADVTLALQASPDDPQLQALRARAANALRSR